MNTFDFGRLVEEHKSGWLADAASLCRVLDWRGFTAGETITFLDAATLPAEARQHVVAWTAPGLDRLLDDGHGGYRHRGPVVVLDVARLLQGRRDPATVTEHELKRLGRLECQQVSLHEFAHVRVSEAAGETLPSSATWPLMLAAAARPQSAARRDAGHGRDWLRCYLHLSYRATDFWPHKWWLDVGFSWDCEAHGLGSGQDFVEALKVELDAAGDEPLVGVLRRDPPAAFTSLFDRRVALRNAARLSA